MKKKTDEFVGLNSVTAKVVHQYSE